MRKLVIPIGVIFSAMPIGAQETATVTSTVTIPFTIDQIFGSRPVIDATINGKPYRLVVHANAGSYLQINHAEAKAVGARDLKHQGAYGISAPGQVSDLGRDDGYVDNLAIGAWRTPSAPVAVFEVPAGGSQGMLGLPFLHDNHAILDFGRKTLTLPSANAAMTIPEGYSAHPLTRDAKDGRYLVNVRIGDATAPMVVSTVATIDLDTMFAARAKVAIGAETGTYGGPSGATGKVHDTAKPISIRIGKWSSRARKVSIEDTYAYARSQRPDDPALARGGALGADFMIEHGAIIDFGRAVMYLRN